MAVGTNVGTGDEISTSDFGYVQYNGVKLTGPFLQVDLTTEPVPDDAGRTTAYTIFRLHVRTILTNDVTPESGILIFGKNQSAGLDAAMNLDRIGGGGTGGDLDYERVLRAAFERQGAELHVDAFGFYFNIGADGSGPSASRITTDCKFGPLPGPMKLTPVGNYLAHQLDWTIEWHAKECLVSTTGGTANSEFLLTSPTIRSAGYSLAYDLDEKGLTTRTVAGHIEIFLNRTIPSSNQIPTIVDAVRDQINVVLPHGFQRVRRAYRISEDKTRLEYMIVDKELPGDFAYPPGILDLNMRHRVATAKGQFATSIQLLNSLSGSLTAAKTHSIAVAFDRVMAIARSRIDAARRQVGKTGFVLITSIDLTRELFGPKTITFDISYIITDGQAKNKNWPPGNITGRSGIFADAAINGRSLRLDGGAWEDWRDSLPELIDNRGFSVLRPTAGSDKIIDACTGQLSSVSFDGQQIPTIEDGRGSLVNRCPTAKDQVYRYYKSQVEVITDPEIVQLQGMATGGSDPGIGDTSEPADEAGGQNQAGNPRLERNDNAKTYEYIRSGGTAYIRLYGCGARFGAWPELPNKILKRLKGKFRLGNTNVTLAAIPKTQHTYNRHRREFGGCKAYSLCWSSLWRIDNYGLTPPEWDQFLEELDKDLHSTISDDAEAKTGGK